MQASIRLRSGRGGAKRPRRRSLRNCAPRRTVRAPTRAPPVRWRRVPLPPARSSARLPRAMPRWPITIASGRLTPSSADLCFGSSAHTEVHTMDGRNRLQATVDLLVQGNKGILAADESGPTIAKRFKAIGVESTDENRRAYRSLLLSTPGLGEFIGGVILYEETLGQRADDGSPLPELAARAGIVPGIKVDAGKIALALAPGDEITQGLDGLAKRLGAYKERGARFAKWRAVYNISDTLPSRLAIEANADSLARYAAICQQEEVVPIVEPEVLMDGGHTLERCADVTEGVLHEVFHALHRHRVRLEHMLLKPSMVVAGSERPQQAPVAEVAA